MFRLTKLSTIQLAKNVVFRNKYGYYMIQCFYFFYSIHKNLFFWFTNIYIFYLSHRLSRSFATNIDLSSLVVKKTDAPVAKLPNSELLFGKTFTDHMLEVDWTKINGWGAPIISPLHNLQIDPAASCIHSALEVYAYINCFAHMQHCDC